MPSVYRQKAFPKPKKTIVAHEATRNWLNEICTKYRPEGYIRSEVRGEGAEGVHESGERVRGLSRLKVSEVRGEGGTLLTQRQGQVSGASDVQPPSPPPDSPIINGSSVKGWSVHVGIGAHRARLAALRESVGFLGEFGSRNREGSVGHNWGRRRHKAAARERPNRGRDDESPSRAEERKNKDATTHPATL